MKVAVLCYHKNAEKIYPYGWISVFRESILNQTYKGFDIFECNYGNDGYRIFENSNYESIPMSNFVHAMNYLLDKCFSNGYDYVFNSNCDDAYSYDWIKKELEVAQQGYDIVSSNFHLINENGIVHTHYFHNRDIQKELEVKHNVVCHPSVCYAKLFWEGNRYDPEQIPLEDMLLWTRAINNGYKFKIVEDVLCLHRLHDNSVGHKLKEE